MCDYCGCRSVETIRDLSEDHEKVHYMSRSMREAIAREDYAGAEKIRPELADFLALHGLKEEVGIYRQLADNGLEERVRLLEQEHEETDTVLSQPITDQESADKVLRELNNLHDHIHEEEYDEFTWAYQVVPPNKWQEVDESIGSALDDLNTLSRQHNSQD